MYIATNTLHTGDFMRMRIVGLILWALSAPSLAGATTPPTLKKVFFIGTGGTIAGEAKNPSDPDYDPGKVTLDAILASVPDLKTLAHIDGEQLLDTFKMRDLLDQGSTEAEARAQSYVNICSCDLGEKHWRLLTTRITKALSEEHADAVIITHGTDTIEETAFALQFLVPTDKPIILVGAARPANHPEADGPDNLRQAVRVAIDDGARGRGVMVVNFGRMYPALDVTEARAQLTTESLAERFRAPHYRSLGTVETYGRVRWDEGHALKRADILEAKFSPDLTRPLPVVPILWQYADNDAADAVRVHELLGRRAFVFAGFGMGAANRELRDVMADRSRRREDEVFVQASRTLRARNRLETDFQPAALNAGTLSPYHAKILLQLILAGLENDDPLVRKWTRGARSNSLRDIVHEGLEDLLYTRLPPPNE